MYFPKPKVRPVALLLLFVGVFVPLCVFGILAEDVMEHDVFSFDKPILVFWRSHASPLLDIVMRLFTEAGSAFVLVPFNGAIFALLLWRRRHRTATFWMFAVAGAALLNGLAKHFFARARPDLWLSRFPETTFSFPSGHAMQSMAVIAALTIILWPTRWRRQVSAFGSFFVLFVGISRIYWGVHYPSDILAGWAASLAWVAGLNFIVNERSSRGINASSPDGSGAVT